MKYLRSDSEKLNSLSLSGKPQLSLHISHKHSLPCKFVLAEDKNLPANLCDDLALVFWSAVLQNMLNDVVTILILQEAVEA